MPRALLLALLLLPQLLPAALASASAAAAANATAAWQRWLLLALQLLSLSVLLLIMTLRMVLICLLLWLLVLWVVHLALFPGSSRLGSYGTFAMDIICNVLAVAESAAKPLLPLKHMLLTIMYFSWDLNCMVLLL